MLKELIHLYKEYQERLLSNNSRMQFEYNSLCDTGKFDNIELLHGKKGVRCIFYHLKFVTFHFFFFFFFFLVKMLKNKDGRNFCCRDHNCKIGQLPNCFRSWPWKTCFVEATPHDVVLELSLYTRSLVQFLPGCTHLSSASLLAFFFLFFSPHSPCVLTLLG